MDLLPHTARRLHLAHRLSSFLGRVVVELRRRRRDAVVLGRGVEGEDAGRHGPEVLHDHGRRAPGEPLAPGRRQRCVSTTAPGGGQHGHGADERVEEEEARRAGAEPRRRRPAPPRHERCSSDSAAASPASPAISPAIVNVGCN